MAQDLRTRAGLTISQEGGRLRFHGEVTPGRLSVRHASDLEKVWREAPCLDHDPEIYAVYWGVVLSKDRRAFRARSLDHAYVIIRAGTVGDEYYKTQGHYHLPTHDPELGEPELYHVLAGAGLFVIQKAAPPDWRVDDVALFHVEGGDVVIVPPNYGHLTVNYGREPLVFEAFMAEEVTPATTPYQERRGGAVYCLSTASGPRIVPNPHYGALPKVREIAPLSWPAPSSETGAFYEEIARQLDRLRWLNEPGAFGTTWIEQLITQASSGDART